MKRKLLLSVSLLLGAYFAQAQFSNTNTASDTVKVQFKRGPSPTNDTTANGVASKFYESPTSGSSSYNGRFFPNITDASYKLRAICYPTDGQFNLSGDILSLKQSVTANGGAKFAVYSIAKATSVVKFSFTLDLSSFTGNNGNALTIAFGNAAGGSTLISSSSPFTSAQGDIFGAFRVIKSGSIVTQFRTADGTTQTNTNKYLIKPSASQTVEIFANTTANAVAYRYRPSDTADSTIAANTYNVYVDGVKHVENFPKVGATYAQSTINALSITLAGNNTVPAVTAETIKISDFKAIYLVSTLPVSLTSFSGKTEANGIRLNWKTASELNNDHFDVLRSTDGKMFNTLTSVSGNGTTNKVNTYSYLDNAPASGTNYYQLSQVDKDGTATKSATVAVDNTLSGQQAFRLNVNGNTLNASFDATTTGTATINITDLSGRSVFSTSLSVQKGANNINLTVPTLNSGVYVATLLQNGKSKSVKFVK